MKKLLILFSCWPFLLWGQVHFDFENGHSAGWIQYPENRWSVTSDQAICGAYSLRHSFDNSVAATDRISLAHGTLDLRSRVQWDFLIRYAYNPSSSNNWAVFLLSDQDARQMHSKGDLEAFILGVNYLGSDDLLTFYTQRGEEITEVFKTGFNWQEEVMVDSVFHFSITRDEQQQLEIRGGNYGQNMQLLGKIDTIEFNFPYAGYFGIAYSYTSSRDRLLTFDNLRIDANILVDSIAPELLKVNFPGRNELELLFNEPVFPRDNFQVFINEGKKPDSIVFDGNKLLCWFPESFINDQDYSITIKALCDREGNNYEGQELFTFFLPARHDLLIAEVMADPSPAVYLPESEYIEIYNVSGFIADLNSWRIQFNNRSWIIPQGTLLPGEYKVLCCVEDTAAFEIKEKVIPAFSGSHVISNSGTDIILKNHLDEVVDAVRYSPSFYDDPVKESGGWALERIDCNYPGGDANNWMASIDLTGGTPGRKNSVDGYVEDFCSPYVDHICYLNDSAFLISFNEYILMEGDFKSNFHLVGDQHTIDNITEANVFCDQFILRFEQPIKNPVMLSTGESIRDFAGNYMDREDSLLLGIPENVVPLDVLITEVLFAPYPGCPEFIEIFNYSDKIVSLGDLLLDIYSPESAPGRGVEISERDVLFFPGDYFVLSPEAGALINFYDIQDLSVLKNCEFSAALKNEGGRIRLTNRSGQVIDELEYSPSAHFPMLTDHYGVSLERMELNDHFGLLANWHSASSMEGYATPGRENSQSLTFKQIEPGMFLEKDVFTPNNDGVDDVAVFRYRLDSEGFVGTMRLFDPSGRIVRDLAINQLLGTKGIFVWDGRDNQGNLCAQGIYLGLMEGFHLSGKKLLFKRSVVLVRDH